MSPAVDAAPLDAARALAALRGLADAIGDATPSGAWLVGGVVRDALLGRSLPDLDIVVDGPAEPAARSLVRALGGGAAFGLGERHGCWRVTAPDHARGDARRDTRLDGVGQVDVCELRGRSIEDDLRERDFTCNAMAVDCADPVRLIDVTEGLDDLAAGQLRMVAATAFDDDPLRLLRTARLAHTLALDVESGTAGAARQRAAGVTKASGERIFAELALLLAAPETKRGLRLLEGLDLLDVLLPELAACRGMRQSRFHHLDVYEHTLAVVDNCEDVLLAPEFWLGDTPGGGEAPGGAGAFTGQERLTVLLAAIMHDLAKPLTRVLRDDGRVGFPGHDRVGRQVVDTVCDRWRTSNELRGALRLLVGTHLDLGYLLHGTLDVRERWRYLRRVQPVAAGAIVLSAGDRLATAGPDDRRRWVRLHLEAVRLLWRDHWREHRDGVPVPLLDGREVAQLAGIEPGPAIGRLVRALAEEQGVGAISTRAEAEEFVRDGGTGDAGGAPA